MTNSMMEVSKSELYELFKQALKAEVVGKHKNLTVLRLLSRLIKKPDTRFYFWFRLAQYLYKKGGRFRKALASHINYGIKRRYNIDISLDAIIGPGLFIGHFSGIVIAGKSIIGRNLSILQNTTIGMKYITGELYQLAQPIIIGDNVEIGAHSCIIGDNLRIGNNVIIGAMSFVNKDIPDNTLYFTKKSAFYQKRYSNPHFYNRIKQRR